MEAISKSKGSEELLQYLLRFSADLSAIENHLKEKKYTSDEISRAGYDFSDECWWDCLDYYDKRIEEIHYSNSVLIPNILSSNMPQIFELLLKYGLNPNTVCEGETVMHGVLHVYNEYVAADTLALLIEHGGNPNTVVDGENLFDTTEMYIIFDAFEQENRRIYDSLVHCWLVLLGYCTREKQTDIIAKRRLLDVFSKRRSECDLQEFKLEDLKEHRNYYYGITNVPGRGENWSLHIFDKRTRWEVVRL